ncbi:MAG: hypothetical protein R3C49_13120 [Planctomycetaceae bacterium]
MGCRAGAAGAETPQPPEQDAHPEDITYPPHPPLLQGSLQPPQGLQH